MSRSFPALLALGLLASCAEPDPAQSDNTQDSQEQEEIDSGFDVSQTAPDFSLPNAEGETVSLSDYRGGRVAVIGTAAW